MELHLRAEARFRENNDQDQNIKNSKANLPSMVPKTVVKRVSVDRITKEFSEERTSIDGDDFGGDSMGMVRKYVKYMKNE